MVYNIYINNIEQEGKIVDIKEAIKARRSIRKYEKYVMPEKDIKAILEAAMLAPSACNTRPWEFVVLKSNDAKERAAKLHPYAKHLLQASIGIMVCARPDLQEGIADGFFPQDCGAAIENMLLMSTELGYGSCWCGIYPRDERTAEFKSEFKLESIPLAIVVIGKAAEEAAQRGFYDETRVKVL